VPKSWTVEGFDEYLHFPDPADRENKHRGWRKFLGVWARDTDGGLWLLACVHIISGTAGACTPPPNRGGVGASSLREMAIDWDWVAQTSSAMLTRKENLCEVFGE
jgi:hypothetical protein